MRKKIHYVVLLFVLYSAQAVYGQAYHGFSIYAKSRAAFTYNNTKISGKYVNKTDERKIFSGNFDGYLMYSLFYNAFYLSFAPEFKMQESKAYIVVREFLLSYSFDALEIGMGKTKENRYLTSNRDYLTVRNRNIAFNDEFSFWKLNMYIPTEYVSVELGSKIIRENDYKFEWKGFDYAFIKPYLYVDFDYAGFSSHLGYAYTYDVAEKIHAHDITGKVFYNHDDIITGYFANLISFEQEKAFSLEDYSYTIGSDFSFVNAFGKSTSDYDVKMTTELIYEKEKYNIVPRVLFFYDELVFVNTFSYTFDDKIINNRSVIQCTVQTVTFRVFNNFSYRTESKNYNKVNHTKDTLRNTFGVEVVYEI